MSLTPHTVPPAGGPRAAAPVPTIGLRFDPPGPVFSIDESATMPQITAIATMPAAAGQSSTPMQFRWRVTVRFSRSNCVHSMGKVTEHPVITATTLVPNFTIPFTMVRGGDLSITVETMVGSRALRGSSNGLSIVGTNPSIPSLVTATTGAPPIFRKLMQLESGLRQFRAPECPLFSADNLGGVGLCQLTPPSSDDQVWDWKANVAGGLALYRAKEDHARRYPDLVRRGAQFRAQVAAYNAARQAAAAAHAPPTAHGRTGRPPPPTPTVPPVTVSVPDYTADELQLDTVCGFNGYAGGLHEYRLRTDENGLLVVHLNQGGRTGTAEWQRISAAERAATDARGDPNYVDDVLA